MRHLFNGRTIALACTLLAASCATTGDKAVRGAAADYDVIIRNGTIYDGGGGTPIHGDVAIRGDKITIVGTLEGAHGKTEVDAQGMAVAPGFINMLSWATDSLIIDGRSLGDIVQGVTLEVFGEGVSYGPVNDALRAQLKVRAGSDVINPTWTTLGGYLEFLEERGVSCNVASFVGATTVRMYTLKYDDRTPNPAELEEMKGLVRQAMEEGAMGVGSSLIYPPAFYAQTPELIELCKVAAEYHGMYISHMRSEGNTFLEALQELITISREAGIDAEVYHLKAAGTANWPKMDEAIAMIEKARAEGLDISANMYTYVAGSTGLDAVLPPWVAEGGRPELEKRLRDPKTRAQIIEEMKTPSDKWENMLQLVGTPENILLVDFDTPKLKPLIGKTLKQVADERGTSPQDTAIDLILEDGTRVSSVYFMMSEDNVVKQLKYPWVSFGSDAGSLAPEGQFLESSTHPRAYGNFARLLGKYVRDEKVMPLEEAVRRLTSLPAGHLKIKDRGRLAEGFFADVVVFDPATIQDHATFEKPHQLSTGMLHVFVNGAQVLKDGEHTGATPGRVVRGPGWKGAR